jgi:hypothetical protein
VVVIRCTGACNASSRLLLHVAVSAGHHRRRSRLVDIGRSSGQAGASGSTALAIKLTANGRRLLRHARKATLTLIVDAAGMELTKLLNLHR